MEICWNKKLNNIHLPQSLAGDPWHWQQQLQQQEVCSGVCKDPDEIQILAIWTDQILQLCSKRLQWTNLLFSIMFTHSRHMLIVYMISRFSLVYVMMHIYVTIICILVTSRVVQIMKNLRVREYTKGTIHTLACYKIFTLIHVVCMVYNWMGKIVPSKR